VIGHVDGAAMRTQVSVTDSYLRADNSNPFRWAQRTIRHRDGGRTRSSPSLKIPPVAAQGVDVRDGGWRRVFVS